MKDIVAGQYPVSDLEFAELAMGVDPELFAGVDGETPEEQAARTDAAQDILWDIWREDRELAVYAAGLLDLSEPLGIERGIGDDTGPDAGLWWRESGMYGTYPPDEPARCAA